MDICFSKTDAGRLALRSREHPLSRTARNLLFALDPTRSAKDWLGMVQGATEADLHELERLGLIEPKSHAASSSHSAKTVPAALPAEPAAPLEPLTYSVLYERLTSAAKEQLGLMKGFKFVLEVEKCADVNELEKLARRLVTEVRTAKGLPEAAKVHRVLGLAGSVGS